MHWLGRVESWSVTGPDPDVPQSSWRGGLCERTGPSLMEQQVSAGGISQKEKVKKETISDCLGNSPAPATPASSPPNYTKGPALTPEALGRVHTAEGPESTPKILGRVSTQTCGTGLEAGQVPIGKGEEQKQCPLSLLQLGRPAKMAWPL